MEGGHTSQKVLLPLYCIGPPWTWLSSAGLLYVGLLLRMRPKPPKPLSIDPIRNHIYTQSLLNSTRFCHRRWPVICSYHQTKKTAFRTFRWFVSYHQTKKLHSVVEPGTFRWFVHHETKKLHSVCRARNFSEFISCKAVAKLRAAEWYKFASITARMELIQWRTYNMEWIHQCYNFFKKKKWRRSSRHDDTHTLHNNPNDTRRRRGPDQAQN